VDSGGRVVGVVGQNRILGAPAQSLVSTLMLSPFFVSKEAVAYEVLRNMQKDKRQIAIVLNPDGSMDGILTMEDLVEEIVGEIDENPFSVPASTLAKSSLIVSGDARLHDIEKELKISLPNSQRFGSVGAFLHYQLKRIPVRGDVIIYGKCRMEVEGVGDDFSLIKIKVELI
jgi:putative hemolysin